MTVAPGRELQRVAPVVELQRDEPRADPDAEDAVLGAIMLRPDVIVDAAAYVEPRDFHSPPKGLVFGAMLALFERKTPIDIVSVCAELAARDVLSTCGGRQGLSMFEQTVATSAHIEAHAKIIADHAFARRIAEAAKQTLDLYNDPRVTPDALAEHADEKLVAARGRKASIDPVDIQDLAYAEWNAIEKACDETAIDSESTGFVDIDKHTDGLGKGHLVVIGARPRVGKTTLAMQIARNIAARGDVLVFSLEMQRDQLMTRLLACEAQIDHRRLRRRTLTQEETNAAITATNRLNAIGLSIDDTPSLSITDIRTRARRYARRRKLRAIVVDYLQLIGPGSIRYENRATAVEAFARGLKALAKELFVPVIAPAQLNRAGKDAPTLEHLRESGGIEAHADTVLLLDREVLRTKKRPNEADLYMPKQRFAESGAECVLRFTGDYVRFDNFEPEAEREPPPEALADIPTPTDSAAKPSKWKYGRGNPDPREDGS